METSPRKPAVSKPRPRQRRVIPGQQSLEFAPAAGAGRYARPSEGAIYCDAPVAIAAHRAMAAAMDGSLIVIALAVFGVVVYLAGGPLVVNAKTLPLVIGVVAVVTFLYRLLWCMANGDSAGMKWARLALVNFDGQKPTRKQRMQRLASGTLSLCAAGLGLIVGAGGRRNANLARPYFKNVPNTVLITVLSDRSLAVASAILAALRRRFGGLYAPLRSRLGTGGSAYRAATAGRVCEPRRSTRSYVFPYGVAVTFANTSLVSISPIGLM